MIYLSVEMAGEAIQSKERLEALAFAVLVKNTYTSSTILNATIRNCKSKFKIGTTRMSRILKNGTRYNYLRREGNRIVANRIRTDNGYNIIIRAKEKNLNGVIDDIRKGVFLNRAKSYNKITDTVRATQSPKNSQEHKNAKRRLKRMRYFKDYGEGGISLSKIENIVKTKRTKARKLIKSLELEGKIEIKRRAKKTNIDPLFFSRAYADYDKTNGGRGYLFLHKGFVYQRITNEYIYQCSDIRRKY